MRTPAEGRWRWFCALPLFLVCCEAAAEPGAMAARPELGAVAAEAQSSAGKTLSSVVAQSATADASAVATAGSHGHHIVYSHGVSYLEPLELPADFPHFRYVNPDAPKGGVIRSPDVGSYDSFNAILDRGRIVAGHDLLGVRNLVNDRLLEQAEDEASSYYGRLADGVWVADDRRAFAFRIREGAYWHDGKPLTVDDVLWTFATLREHGSAGTRTALQEIDRVERIGEREVLFTIKAGVQANPALVFAVGSYPILPQHYWATRDITKTSLEPPLGSGPYRVGDMKLGRYITYERVEDYWGRDIPVNKGRYNFDHVKFDYFRDEAVMVEGLKADVIDVRHETAAKLWSNSYDFPAVRAGFFRKEMVHLNRPWGMWAPGLWNLDRPRFQDIRVREALWLLYDFRWINRVMMFGVYRYANSFFFNSKMAQSGLPSADELALLEPWRDQLPPRVFTHEWQAPDGDGMGFNRHNVVRAIELFRQAGWEIRDGVMTHVATGDPFVIDFIFDSPMLLRGFMPFVGALERVGIQTAARSPERSNWQYRMRTGRFDGGAAAYAINNTPGLALRNTFSSQAADHEYSQNWARIRNPVVDALIDKVISARTARDFYAATRALDRVLLWNFYWIPGMAAPGFRLVHWDRFGRPAQPKPLLRDAWLDTWWWDEAKATRVREGMAKLTKAG